MLTQTYSTLPKKAKKYPIRRFQEFFVEICKFYIRYDHFYVPSSFPEKEFYFDYIFFRRLMFNGLLIESDFQSLKDIGFTKIELLSAEHILMYSALNYIIDFYRSKGHCNFPDKKTKYLHKTFQVKKSISKKDKHYQFIKRRVHSISITEKSMYHKSFFN